MTISCWMLNNATNQDMLTNMCQMIAANTKKGGKTLILVATSDQKLGHLFDAREAIKIKDVKPVFDEEGLVIGLEILKINFNDKGEVFHYNDWFYSDNRIKTTMEKAGFSNISQVPTLPVPTSKFGLPHIKAQEADELHYKIFFGDKL